MTSGATLPKSRITSRRKPAATDVVARALGTSIINRLRCSSQVRCMVGPSRWSRWTNETDRRWNGATGLPSTAGLLSTAGMLFIAELLLGPAPAGRGVVGQRGDEGLLRHLDPADHLHPLLAFLLLLEQLALTGDVTAVALGKNVLAHGADGLAGDDPGADRGLDRHLELLARDELAQLGRHHDAVGVSLVLVHDRAEGIDRLALEKDVHLDQVGGLLAVGLVVERGVSAGLGLQLVEEVEDDLGQRERVAHLDALLGEVVHAAQRAAAGLAQLHHGSDELAGAEDRRTHDRLADVADLAVRELAGVGHGDDLAVVELDLVDHVGQRRDQVEVELTLEPLAHDLQVQHAEEPDPETETERG